jgi:hypothetical protein
MSAIVGRSVEPRVVPYTERLDVYRARGVTGNAALAISEMVDGFNSGWIAFEGGDVERMFGKTPFQEALGTFAAASSIASN